MKYPIAVDIGNQFIYAVQLKQTRNGVEIRAMVQKDFESAANSVPDADFGLISAVEEMSKNRRFRGKSVALHIRDRDTSVFPIRFHVEKNGTVEGEIIQESEKYLSYPLDEAIIDYPSLTSGVNSDPGSYKAMIVAARRESIDQYARLMKRAKLTLEAVEYRVSSLIRLHKYFNEITEQPVILCNIGHEETLLAFVSRDSILAQRIIPWGIHLLYEKILANLEPLNTKDNAKLLLKTHGLAYEDEKRADDGDGRAGDEIGVNMHKAIYQIIMPSVDELVYEFHKMISYVRSELQDTVFESIYLYGHSAWIHHLDRYFQRRIGLPTQCVNPLTEMVLSDNHMLSDISEGSPYALALGLAMRKVQWL